MLRRRLHKLAFEALGRNIRSRYATYLAEDILVYIPVESENGKKRLEDLELDVHRLVGDAGECCQNPRQRFLQTSGLSLRPDPG